MISYDAEPFLWKCNTLRVMIVRLAPIDSLLYISNQWLTKQLQSNSGTIDTITDDYF